MPLTVCYMHAKVHLAYLQIHFQIYHLLGEDSSTPLPELLEVSADILETVVQMGNSRNKGVLTFGDMPEIVRTTTPFLLHVVSLTCRSSSLAVCLLLQSFQLRLKISRRVLQKAFHPVSRRQL